MVLTAIKSKNKMQSIAKKTLANVVPTVLDIFNLMHYIMLRNCLKLLAILMLVPVLGLASSAIRDDAWLELFKRDNPFWMGHYQYIYDGGEPVGIDFTFRQPNPYRELTGSGDDWILPSSISNIDSLSHLPLRFLRLPLSNVTSLEALQNMPLEELVLCEAPLRSLKGVPTGVLRVLDVSATPIRSLEPLKRAWHLERLALAGCAHVADLSPLASLALLKTLDIRGVQAWDCSPVQGINLEEMDMSSRHISSFSKLSIDSLKTFRIMEPEQYCQDRACDQKTTTDYHINSFAPLPNLEKIVINFCIIEDLSFLSSSSRLEQADFRASLLPKDWLHKLPQDNLIELTLKQADIYDNQGEESGYSLNPLAAAVKLTTLDVSMSPFHSIPNLTLLESLDISNTLIQSLPSLPNLHVLKARHTLLTSLPVLSELRVLDISNTRLTNIPRESRPSLVNLQIDSTSFSDFSFLAEMPSLVTLHASHCDGALISKAPFPVSLKHLSLSHMNNGLPNDFAIPTALKLVSLNLGGNIELSHFPKMTTDNLRFLWITNTRIKHVPNINGGGLVILQAKGSGLVDISGIVSTRTQILNLSGCPIESFATLHDTSVMDLNLTNTPFGDDDMPLLRDLPLFCLSLRGSAVKHPRRILKNIKKEIQFVDLLAKPMLLGDEDMSFAETLKFKLMELLWPLYCFLFL